MAKVKIQGHASGTGVLTVTAPNTSTDRTITLPDATGTLALTTGDDDKLPLTGGTLTGDVSLVKSSGNSQILVEASGTDAYATVRVKNDAKDYSMQIRSDQGDSWTVRDETAGVNRLLIQSDGSLLVGTTDGGSSGAGDIVASAIFLGGNQAANELDDYEEGTWTIVLTGSNSGSGNVGTGYYTKVGRTCHCIFIVDDATTPTFSGTLQYSLPFTGANIASRQENSGDCYTYPLSKWTTGSDYQGVTFQIYGANATTGLFVLKRTNTHRQTPVSSSQGSNSNTTGFYSRFSITYTTA